MTLEVIVNQLKEFVWGPVSLVFLVGTGVYLSKRRRLGVIFPNCTFPYKLNAEIISINAPFL